MNRRFAQVDVFSGTPYLGNPVAVVLDGDGLSTEQMSAFGRWTNLSETTFVLAPEDPRADYRLRIFTAAPPGAPDAELAFAGHPTLGSAHAWLQSGGTPRDPATIVQECAAGLIRVRRSDGGLAFAAPALRREGPVADALLARVAAMLDIDRGRIVDAAWADNGPGWIAVLLEDEHAVLDLRPGRIELPLGVVGPARPGSPHAIEVRAFAPGAGGLAVEDPVTGSLNAAVAQWLLGSGRLTAPYTARQGTALGRAGRVEITQDAHGTVWVGGATVTCVTGTAAL